MAKVEKSVSFSSALEEVKDVLNSKESNRATLIFESFPPAEAAASDLNDGGSSKKKAGEIVLGRNLKTSCFSITEPEVNDEITGDKEAYMASVLARYRQSLTERTKHHLDRIIRALEKHEVTKIKMKILRFETEVTKQGKRVESLTVESRSNRFEFVLSDGTTHKKGNGPAKPKKTGKNNKKLNRVTPVEKFPIDPPSQQKITLTLVGRSENYDEKCSWVEEYQPGVNVVLVTRRDGIRDILKVKHNKGSVPQNTIWWIENEEKVCKRFNVDAVRPRKEPLISCWTYYIYPKIAAN